MKNKVSGWYKIKSIYFKFEQIKIKQLKFKSAKVLACISLGFDTVTSTAHTLLSIWKRKSFLFLPEMLSLETFIHLQIDVKTSW